ncbi:hypothetical protein ACRAWG_30845 [Methylobacterium sp. P31]
MDDLLKGNPITAIGIGAAVVAVPVLFPSLRPQWAAAVKGGTKLFLEAEGGAEGDIIDGLAEKAIDQLVDAIAHHEPEQRREAAAAVISGYKRQARARADRHGYDEKDRAARFHRHMARLRHKVARRHARASDDKKASWDRIATMIGEGSG